MDNLKVLNKIFNRIKTLFNSHNVYAIYVDHDYNVFEYNPQTNEIIYEWHRDNFISEIDIETELSIIYEQLKTTIGEIYD